MASFFITGNDTTGETLVTGENGFVSVNATLYTETTQAVTVSGSSTLTVMGTVATAEALAAVRTSTAVATFGMTVGALGSVLSSGTDAMRLQISDTFTLNTAGLISGRLGVYVTGTTSTTDTTSGFINNAGTILGTGVPDSFAPAGAVTFSPEVDTADIVKSGTISGGQSLAAIHNQGDGSLRVQNSGSILASADLTYAIVSNGSLGLTNTGEIQQGVLGDSAFISNSGVIGDDISMIGRLSLTNSGTVLGNILANSQSGFVGAVIENSGAIMGSIIVGGGGADSFRNVGGTIMGRVNLGNGQDQYFIDDGLIFIEDNGSTGTDTVTSTASYQMGLGIENLVLEGPVGLAGIGNTVGNSLSGTTSGDTLRGLGGQDTLFGNDGDDILHGNNGPDTVYGGDGNDTMMGGAGDDLLDGGAGDDVMHGHGGNDRFIYFEGFDAIYGGSGRDMLEFFNMNQGVVVTLAPGLVSFTDAGGEVTGSATLAGIEDVTGTNAADAITGSNSNNVLIGGLGADTLNGGNGNDTLFGGAAQDALIGGTGSDTFVFVTVSDSVAGNGDRISGFQRPFDVIDVEAIYGDENAPVDVPFDFLGTAAFTGAGPELRYTVNTVAGTTTIEVRLAGSLINDMEIVLNSAVALLETNFIL